VNPKPNQGFFERGDKGIKGICETHYNHISDREYAHTVALFLEDFPKISEIISKNKETNDLIEAKANIIRKETISNIDEDDDDKNITGEIEACQKEIATMEAKIIKLKNTREVKREKYRIEERKQIDSIIKENPIVEIAY